MFSLTDKVYRRTPDTGLLSTRIAVFLVEEIMEYFAGFVFFDFNFFHHLVRGHVINWNEIGIEAAVRLLYIRCTPVW